MHQVLVTESEYVRRKTFHREDYITFLFKHGVRADYDGIRSCGEVAVPWQCEGQERHVVYRRWGCRDPDCSPCSLARAMNQAKYDVYKIESVYRRLNRAVRFVEFDYTVPEDMRSVVYRRGMEAFEKLVVHCFDEYVREMFDVPDSVQLCIIITPQYWSSDEPLTKGPLPHVHGVLFSLGFDKKTGEPFDVPVMEFGRFAKHPRDPNFEVLRGSWRSALKTYGEPPSKVNVWVNYGAGTRTLYKRLQYFFRSPTSDVYKWIEIHGVPESVDECWLRELLAPERVDDNGKLRRSQKMRYYGWLAPRNCSPNAPLMQRYGITLKSRTDYRCEESVINCPCLDRKGRVCGCIMERSHNLPRKPVVDVLEEGLPFMVAESWYEAQIAPLAEFDPGG